MRQRKWITGAMAALPVFAAAVVVPTPASASLKVEQLPGGQYRGAVAGGKQIQLEVRARGSRGLVRMRCARVRDRFRIRDDGSFRVSKRNRRGRIVLRVRGRFNNLTRVRGRVTKLRRGGRRCRQGRFRARLKNVRGLKRTTVSYGPYHVEPSGGHEGGGHGGAGGNVVHTDVAKPCEDCYIVGMLPDLVDASGTDGGHSRSLDPTTEAKLHHIVFFNRDRDDATCDGPVLGRERFFAAGSERTMFVLPAGYGYRIDRGDTWWTLAHLMNMGMHPRHLNVEVTFWYVDAPANLRHVKPFWFDINNCGNSEYMTPAGRHTETWDFTIPPELSGRVVAIGGHQHDYGVGIELTNQSRGGRSVCRAVPDYGAGHIERIRGCVGDPVATLRTGEVVRLHSTYDSPEAQHDAMGIMLGYLAPWQAD
jgi:hypothetical protein